MTTRRVPLKTPQEIQTDPLPYFQPDINAICRTGVKERKNPGEGNPGSTEWDRVPREGTPLFSIRSLPLPGDRSNTARGRALLFCGNLHAAAIFRQGARWSLPDSHSRPRASSPHTSLPGQSFRKIPPAPDIRDRVPNRPRTSARHIAGRRRNLPPGSSRSGEEAFPTGGRWRREWVRLRAGAPRPATFQSSSLSHPKGVWRSPPLLFSHLQYIFRQRVFRLCHQGGTIEIQDERYFVCGNDACKG